MPASDLLHVVQDHVPTGLPAWALAGAANCYGLVTTTSEQYVLLVEINVPAANGQGPVVTEAIGDAGSTQSLIDLDLARKMGLPV